MRIIKYLQNNVALGILIPISVILSLSLLSYFFINKILKTGKKVNHLEELILKTEELVSLTYLVKLDITKANSSGLEIDHGVNSTISHLRQGLENQEGSEKLSHWIQFNLLNPDSSSFSIHQTELDELVAVLTDLKNQEKMELLDLKGRASAQIVQFAFWAIGVMILGIIFSIIWARSFWLNLKTGELMERKLKGMVTEVNDLYDNSPCGYFSVNSDYMLENINNTLVKWLGYKKKEVIDRFHVSDILQISKDWLNELMTKLDSNSFVENLEVEVKRKDGTVLLSVLNVNKRTSLIRKDQELRFTLFDNSERKNSEIKIQNLNKELEAFSYSVSHDLRAPLRSISGYIHILKEDYHEILESSGAMPTVEVIIRNSSKMGQLIDDLLDFARVNRKQLTMSAVNMHTLVAQVMGDMLHGQAQLVNFQQHELLNCQGDHNLIQQVWINLLSNAIKYSSKKDQPFVEIGNMESEEEIIYYVKDNGAGFEMEYAHKLFGVFQRLHNDSEFKGTGVGLALVKRIVERHNGRVWAESEVGVGSTFYFSLPKVDNTEINGTKYETLHQQS